MPRHHDRGGHRSQGRTAPLIVWVIGVVVAFLWASTMVGVAMRMESQGSTRWWLVVLLGLPPAALLVVGVNRIIGGLFAPGGDDVRDIDRLTGEHDRMLTTVLFADIVSSTELLTEVGDRRWSSLVAEFLDAAHRCVDQHAGMVVDTAGDGVLAAFAAPGRAIDCATAIRSEARRLGMDVRVGLHSGEMERIGRKVRGIGVHVGARVIAAAEPGEILVTSTVRDLATGSGIRFEDRGCHELKGVADPWRLYAVV